MRDLELWRRLESGDASAPETVVLVEELAATALGARGPFLDAIAPLTAHASPAVRAAATRALASASGVPGVRAIVARLDDDDANVRGAAVAALRRSSLGSPRYVHALFHPRADVRRAALGDVPPNVAFVVPYLRGDPACAALVDPGYGSPLPLAIDLHASAQLSDRELLEAMTRGDLRAFLERERGRPPEVVDAYLAEVFDGAQRSWRAAPGDDAIDQMWSAIAAVPGELAARDALIAAVTARKPLPDKSGSRSSEAPARDRTLLRRAIASLMTHVARAGASPHAIALCCALEPRTLELAAFDPADAQRAAAGLIDLHWPVRPAAAHVERLLRLPIAQADLAVAAALAGLFSGQRLRRLATNRSSIVKALIASDRGWDEICALPGEHPARELQWLARVEAAAPQRYVALAARALAAFTGPRLEKLIDQIMRRYRPAVLLAFLAPAEQAPDAPRATNVCRVFASRLDRAGIGEVLEALLTGSEHDAAHARTLARAISSEQLAAAASGLGDRAVARLVAMIDGENALPHVHELALAAALAARPLPAIAAWVRAVTAGAVIEAPAVPLAAVAPRRALFDAERERIASCDPKDLARAVKPALAAPVSGLVDALAGRAPLPSVEACVALLGCTDPYAEVAAQLDRFVDEAPRFAHALDIAAQTWQRHDALPPLAAAALYCWEAHNFALARWIAASGGVLAVLRAIEVPGEFAARTMWRGIAEVVVLLRYRDPIAFAREATRELAEYAAARVDQPFGAFAARIAVALVESRAVPYAAIKAIILEHTPDARAEAREHLRRIAQLDGMPEPPPQAEPVATRADALAQVRACTDLDALVAWCRAARPAVVQEAVLALLLHGETGQLRLAALLRELDALPAPAPVLESIALWDAPAALVEARALGAGRELAAPWRFRLALALHAHGDAGQLARAFAAVREPSPNRAWFRRDDWEKLVELADPLACAIALADSPHHHAYQPAVKLLLDEWDAPEVGAALRRFLEIGTDRPLQLRRDCARRLALEYADLAALPIVIHEIATDEGAAATTLLEKLPAAAALRVAEALVAAAMIGGDGACTEKLAWVVVVHLHDAGKLDGAAFAQICARILDEASTPGIRRAAAAIATSAAAASDRLRQVAEVFAWGVRRGRELTGRRMRIHLTSKQRDFGHTRMDGDRIYVSPLPLLRREPHGRDVVEGLVLHELGHHVYHRGRVASALWQQAHDEGLGKLLNLVADEHLERNLRALDPAYGDRLKRLGAYVFQHAGDEIPVGALLDSLRGGAARALIATDLEVAFDERCVRLRRGAVLAELERAGQPLARFVRALRMGLGNRHGDPLVAAALELCKPVRRLDMPGLYDLTRRLAALFGGAISVAEVFGGPEGLGHSERDDDVYGNLDDELLQREVERILEPPGSRGRGGPRDRLSINVNPDERFAQITRVERVRGDRAEHAAIATDVRRHAARLRAYLDELGLRREPMKARLSGHALDRGRLRALVTRGDPRILVARTPVRRTDLFLATVVDCSGSMTAGGNIDRARRFAILIAEAVRALPGVESRCFGFTDSLIYDAGDAADCGATGLRAEGGNNDAAALFYAANVAAASRKRAKVVVMISDGLPTECSVASVRALVKTLTQRRGILCAQVAVRPLEEVLFPNYVVLDDDELDVAVARFGRMIGELARRALA